MTRLNKKGLSLGQLVPAILTLVILVVVISVGLKIGSDMRDKVNDGATVNSTVYQGANDSLQSLTEIASWSDLIGLVIAAAIILGLVLGAIAIRGGRE